MPISKRRKSEIAGTKDSPQSPGEKVELSYSSQIIESIRHDIEEMGLVGDSDVALLVYLVATSRLLPRPLHAIIQGHYSSGKSLVQSIVEQLIPVDQKLNATTMSAQALYYYEGSLEHTVIFKGERSHRRDEDQADVTAPLRQLMSEHKISKIVTVPGDDVHTTAEVTQKGPIALIETTTQKNIFAEDKSRCLVVNPDESARQTQAVVSRILADDDLQTDKAKQKIVEWHHKFQSGLKSASVVIPFHQAIAANFPSASPEARRAAAQVKSLIHTITLLHQQDRQRDSQDRLVATIDDYAIARRLLFNPFRNSIGKIDEKTMDLYNKLKTRFPNGFDAKNAIDPRSTNLKDRAAVGRATRKLIEADVLVMAQKGRPGHPAVYKWTGKQLGEVLPDIDVVRSFETPKT